MEVFMMGIMYILTSSLFLHFFGLAFVTASGLLFYYTFNFKSGGRK